CVVQQDLYSCENGTDFAIQVSDRVFDLLHRTACLHEESNQHTDLQDQRDCDDHSHPVLHAHPSSFAAGANLPDRSKKIYDFAASRRYASRAPSTAAEIDSFCFIATSLPRSINSSARSRSSRALRCAYSRPSSAFFARNSRVSSPDFGANKIPTRAPTPKPHND